MESVTYNDNHTVKEAFKWSKEMTEEVQNLVDYIVKEYDCKFLGFGVAGDDEIHFVTVYNLYFEGLEFPDDKIKSLDQFSGYAENYTVENHTDGATIKITHYV